MSETSVELPPDIVEGNASFAIIVRRSARLSRRSPTPPACVFEKVGET